MNNLYEPDNGGDFEEISPRTNYGEGHPKRYWTKEEVEKLTESSFAEGIKAGEDLLALPTPRVRYNEWKLKNL